MTAQSAKALFRATTDRPRQMDRHAITYACDCREAMRAMPADSIDSIVTDPPYGLSFMGKGWDRGVPGVEFWQEAFRVLKPGGWLLAFGGTRTVHRLVCAIEDAGFEIRDQIGWAFGSGFPKSHDVAKGIDRAAGAEGQVVPQGASVKRMIPGADHDATGSWIKDSGRTYQPGEYLPATEDAARWQGWGTALKPAWEPICVARKPLDGTVAENVLTWGTGALNIDGCRVETSQADARDVGREITRNTRAINDGWGMNGAEAQKGVCVVRPEGRWPANLIHDGSDEVVALFPQSDGQAGAVRGTEASRTGDGACYGEYGRVPFQPRNDTGSAARFFYCAKASAADRDEGLDHLPTQQFVQFQTGNGASGKPSSLSEGRDTQRRNTHPTVKPEALMRYLCRLVTPPGGVVLDPFMGSGSTGKGAVLEGFRFIGCELTPEYLPIAEARIARAVERALEPAKPKRAAKPKKPKEAPAAMPLFAWGT